MADDFKIVAITPPHQRADEALRIWHMLESGAVDMVHLRHPDASYREMSNLIEAIPQKWHSRLRLHGHFVLLNEFNLAGPHLNRRCPEWNLPVVKGKGAWHPTVSKSCHKAEELREASQFEYVTLSPIYPSISKPGYRGNFNIEKLADELAGRRVIALGGVTPDKFHELRKAGFAGAALLGYIWYAQDTERTLRRIKMMRGDRFSLQYITNGATPYEVEAEVQGVLAGGCRWVQVRMKEADDEVVAEALRRVKPMCAAKGAILLVDDRVALVNRLGIDGVHLGKTDMAPAEARNLLGRQAIIGSTANNLDQVKALDFENIDYVGVGPLRFTTTKKNLAPVLGLDGYQQIMSYLRSQEQDLPIVAIGGIVAEDVAQLRATGVSGVAVSGAIANAPDPKIATMEFLKSNE
ncbi:MAG: thiamine phosphate synthase [Bacteroidales bacterium]|nr:thiamine phosphate synthase [Bacteroidales bacterium]